MNLPAEMRGLIYNKLAQKEVLNTRVVSKQWAEEIVEFFEFSIKLDERKAETMEKLRNLKIKSCKVINFFNPPTTSSRTSFFKYPKFIRQLTIDTRWISQLNFQLLMQECSQYLEELTIELRDMDEENFDLDEEVESDTMLIYPLRLDCHCDFQNLRKLTVSDERDYSDVLLSELENDIFLRLVRNPSITKLRSLTISWEIPARYIEHNVGLKLSGAIISLFARQWKTLETVGIKYSFDAVRNAKEAPLSIFKMIDTTLWEKLESLKEIDLDFASLYRDEEEPDVQTLNIWSDCLRNQKRLDAININHAICYPLFLQIVVANFATLTDVTVLLSFQNHPKGPFDISIFKNCKILQQLSLKVGLFAGRITLPAMKRDIINLRELPKCIKKLHLESFGISLGDLDAFFSQGKELKPLEEFWLIGYERSGKPRVNAPILEKVLDSPGILNIQIDSSLGFDTSTAEEWTKLNAVFNRFNAKYDDRTARHYKSLFLSRASINEPFLFL